MTQEEKARAYDEAIKRAKSLIGDTIIEESGQRIAEVIFPELKESEGEDEKIKKRLIDLIYKVYANTSYITCVEHEDMLAWLEKQGEQKSILNIPSREVILSIWDLGNEWKELTNGCISTEYGTQLDYIQKHWHESEYYLKEKQGEQKPAKVEPKFKVGDWIIDKQGLAHQIENVVENVTNHTFGYDIVGGGYFNDNSDVRLWTIQDAKDGDILVASDGSIFIFNSLNNNGCKFYVAATVGNKLVINRNLKHHWETSTAVHPATKTQRDILAKAMLSLGYTFDFDKKELNKSNSYCQEHCKGFQETSKCFADGDCKDKREAEQKSACSKEDEQPLQSIIDEMQANKNQALEVN